MNPPELIEPETTTRTENDASSKSLTFRLTDTFLQDYKNIEPEWGFNGLGKLVYERTYSRVKVDGSKERWWETVARVVEGIYSLQKDHINRSHLGWDEDRGQRSAQNMFKKIFNFKFTPPGRGFWVMGTPIIHDKGLGLAVNNCAYVSTEFIDNEDPTFPFCFLMDASMQGTGVGFDLKGAGKIEIYQPNLEKTKTFTVPDSREGWVESVKVLLNSYFKERAFHVEFDYSQIRAAGAPIKTFGGVSSGSKPLEELHDRIRKYLNKDIGGLISERSIIDIQNAIGCAVVAGNVRRSAEIVFGSPHSEYIHYKDYEQHPDRMEIGWASNNSVYATVGMDYSDVAAATAKTGEPGYFWLDNAREYGRMSEPKNYKDRRASGGNPCLEQTLEHGEVCCLVETYPFNHESRDEFKETLKYAYLYAKTVTLIPTNWAQTNQVVFRNRRIGTSMSGIAQFVEEYGLHEFKEWCEEGYATLKQWDQTYSDWFGINTSIKLTSIKPSGSVSLLCGATPGMHYPISRYYIRRIRLAENSDLIPDLKAAGYKMEPDQFSTGTTVVEFPVDCGVERSVNEQTLWEQTALASFLQVNWADNQVSCTVTVDPSEKDQIKTVLDYFQYTLKGISFLPKSTDVYPQMPYESITEAEYDARLTEIDTTVEIHTDDDATVEKYCDGDNCTL